MPDSLNGVVINEFHQNPAGAGQDYNGDGVADGNDLFIELHNTTLSSVDLNGWQLHVYPPGAWAR